MNIQSSIVSTLILVAGSAMGSCPPAGSDASVQDQPVLRCGLSCPQEGQPTIDVVFVLDTTGSMGGLIEGAKQKIWAIANEIATAQPAPIVRMGLVGYRDRGDQYVTTITELTDDLDSVYSDLMSYQAQGGGDTPESVNEALFQAVERFDWTREQNALRLVYLVGDAPPKMEYEDDVKYRATCRLAYEQGININAIQCGSDEKTKAIWEEIAQHADGAYAAIEQGGGVVAISTPFDDEIAQLDAQIAGTMIDYGNADVMVLQESKREAGSKIYQYADTAAVADRAVYNQSAAGRKNVFGLQELVDDVINDRVQIGDIEKDHLPETMQTMSAEELGEEITRVYELRESINKKIKDLAQKRSAFLKENKPELERDGFDQKVLDALHEQGSRVGIRFKDDPQSTE